MDGPVVVLAGGVGAARFLEGLVSVMDPTGVTAIVNTGDDLVIHGLHVSPDIDTVAYTLSGLGNRQRGWGLRDETWSVMDALGRLGGDDWFRLGDRDLATHLYRTGRLAAGATLSEVTAELAERTGVPIRLLPMSDDPVATRVVVEGVGEIGFQDYFVGRRHAVTISSVRFEGVDGARPAPGLLDALIGASRIVIAPSNPIVSIGPILAVPGIEDSVAARRDDVIAVSPIVAGAALKGPASRMLVELGHESSVVGVARIYAAVAGALVIDEADAGLAAVVEAEGLRCVVAPTVMSDPKAAATLAEIVLRG